LKLSASSRVENNLAIILYSTELRIPTDVSCICFLTKVLLETQARAIQLERTFPATQEDEDSIEAGDSLHGASRGIEDSREIGTPVPGATGDAKFSGMWSFVAG